MSVTRSAEALNLHHQSDTACFSVVAAAMPGVLERVLELFAKEGMVPSKLHLQADDELSLDIQVAGMPADRAEYFGRRMRQIFYVDRVFVSRLAGR